MTPGFSFYLPECFSMPLVSGTVDLGSQTQVQRMHPLSKGYEYHKGFDSTPLF